jgi:N-acetylglucosaminyldiphosphoundecaprenol N-acetyl-beta-D-mannosaminyltransferase
MVACAGQPPRTPGRSARVAGLDFDALPEQQVVARIVGDLAEGRGGWVVTPNIDICRQLRRDPAARDLVSGASLVVADGMPLVWASRLGGSPLPERVAGASLIFTLSAAAAAAGKSVYLLGGEPGVPARAAAALARRYPSLLVAGTCAPPFGFDRQPGQIQAIAAELAHARPDIVFVGLGFPKQEHLIAALVADLPAAWFIGCGAAIPFAAGALPRAPHWMQRLGLEWAHRLASEPRRLFRRYLVDDLPFALRLIITSAAARRKDGPREAAFRRSQASGGEPPGGVSASSGAGRASG